MPIWDQLIDLSEQIETLFDEKLICYDINEDINFTGWKDTFWESNRIRKCHLKTIDNRSTQKMWLLHVNIFPKENLSIPILGFDIVAGENKITGSFFDYSPVCNTHFYMDKFKDVTKDLEWNKPRELPDWAKAIFSKHMIAVGNIKTDLEIQQLSDTCFKLIEFYLDNINSSEVEIGLFKDKQNYYCKQQKLNPHLHRSILSMGISEEDKNKYINSILFEEIE